MGLGFSGPGYNGPQETKYLFIDGGCLRSLLNDFSTTYFNGQPINLDYSLFTQGFTKVFYYDSLPPKKDSENDLEYGARTQDIRSLELLDRFHVYLGDTRYRKKRLEQKQVDTMIAIDMLKHSFNKNMHKAALLTTDSDFIPLIDALVENGMYVSLWYGETKNCKASKELLRAADSRNKIGIHRIYDCCKDEFTMDNFLPKKSQSLRRLAEPVQEWNDPQKGHLYLFKDEKGYEVAYKSTTHRVNYSYYSHPDFNVLKTYCQEELNILIPSN